MKYADEFDEKMNSKEAITFSPQDIKDFGGKNFYEFFINNEDNFKKEYTKYIKKNGKRKSEPYIDFIFNKYPGDNMRILKKHLNVETNVSNRRCIKCIKECKQSNKVYVKFCPNFQG